MALKLNQGSNSWMIDSYLMTEKILTSVATEQMSSKMVMRMAGFHLLTGESALNIRVGLNIYSIGGSVLSNQVLLHDASQLAHLLSGGRGVLDEPRSALVSLAKDLFDDELLYLLFDQQLPHPQAVLFVYDVLAQLVDQLLAFLF